MNETEKQLGELIKKAIEVAERTGEFAIEQAPLLLQEFYNWHITKSIIIAIAFLIVKILVGRIGLLYSFKNKDKISEGLQKKYYLKKDGRFYKSSYGDHGSENYNITVVSKVISYFFLIGVALNIYKIIFIVIAPKIYLIEYFIN